MHVAVVLAVLLMLPGSAAADERGDRFWLSASVGVGAGTQRFGAMNLVAKLDGYVWLRDGLGLVATASGHHTSDLDAVAMNPAADGSVLAGGVAYRVDLEKVAGTPHHLHVAGLVGRDHEQGFAWITRIGIHRRRGVLLFSVDLVGYGSVGAGASWLTTLGVGVAM